jgi:uncharacterized protein YggE
MMRRGASVLVAVLALAAIGCAQGMAAEPPVPGEGRLVPTINVSGTGKVFVRPDTAVAQIGAEARAPSLTDATADVARRMNGVVQRLKALGIADRDIATVVYSVEPIVAPRRGEEDPVRILGFRVANIVRVAIRDIQAAGRIVEAALKEGATTLHGLHFVLDDPGPAEAVARTQAVREAATKARQLADAAGVRLGDLVTLSEAAHIPRPLLTRFEAVRSAIAAPGAPGPIETGELQVVVTVEAQYRIAR